MTSVARLGDTSSHGGAIASASLTVFADGIGVARQGDSFNCPIHGMKTLNANQSVLFADGLAIITVGATATCGAVITQGSPIVSEI